MSRTSTEHVLEIRRHAERHKPGDNLNRAGVARARRASACDRTFARVVTSQLPRAVQTAVAMGHSVDEEDRTLASMGAEIPWEDGFAAIAEVIRSQPAARAAADGQARRLRHHLHRAGGDLLVVSHGGVVELGVIGLLGDADAAALGSSLGYVEGVRMWLAGDHVTRLEMLRFDTDDRETATDVPLA